MSDDEIYSKLINLAAEMVMGKNMPSSYHDDHNWYKKTCISERRRILIEAVDAQKQCILWAISLREIANSMIEKTNKD